jgi:acid phosphatase type 7
VSGTTGQRWPLLWTAAILILALLAESASAATRIIAPTRQLRGSAEFKLTGIRPADVRRAYLKVGKRETKLPLATVRRAAGRGVLKVKLPRRPARRHSTKAKHPRVRLRIVLFDAVVNPAAVPPLGGTPPPPPPPPPPGGDPVIAAAGDIACDPDPVNEPYYNDGNGTATNCRQKYTAPLLAGSDAVLTLGDESYGYVNAFETVYDPTWGQYRPITHPIPGDHDYDSGNIDRYAAYFGAAAGEAGKFYYSFDVGSWHVIALNSNCAIVSCAAGDPQAVWLRADLAAHSNVCTIAYWHHPHFTDGPHVPDDGGGSTQPFWDALYAAHADVVLHGNDHNYQRWSRIDASGLPAPDGIREFVVGTGGKSHTTPTGAGAEVRDGDTFGVLDLTLHEGSYDWQFVPEPGATFTDQGSDTCSA